MFTLKKWNAIAVWTWEGEADNCAICRINLMETCLRCQADPKADECFVAWGECNHSFHNCCISQWVKQRNMCPICQQEWIIQRIGK